jgi:hypothetical protein
MNRGNVIEYDNESDNLFDGGNEFRHIDLKSILHKTDRMLTSEFDTGYYQIVLKTDEKRTFKVYETDDDINGKLLIKTEEGKNSSNEGDYAWVYFNLQSPNPILTGSVYLTGGLTNWQFNKASVMNYSYSRKSYYTRLLLKQGYYNYQYVVLETGSKCGDVAQIEGNHYETTNEYNIWVYYHTEGNDYDQLIGVASVQSNQ